MFCWLMLLDKSLEGGGKQYIVTASTQAYNNCQVMKRIEMSQRLLQK